MHGCLWLIARITFPENNQQVYTCKIRIFKHIYAIQSAHLYKVTVVLVRDKQEAVAELSSSLSGKATVEDLTSDMRAGL